MKLQNTSSTIRKQNIFSFYRDTNHQENIIDNLSILD